MNVAIITDTAMIQGFFSGIHADGRLSSGTALLCRVATGGVLVSKVATGGSVKRFLAVRSEAKAPQNKSTDCIVSIEYYLVIGQ
jgi:hypothetical protein